MLDIRALRVNISGILQNAYAWLAGKPRHARQEGHY